MDPILVMSSASTGVPVVSTGHMESNARVTFFRFGSVNGGVSQCLFDK